jgi:hypothetical protein
MAPDELNLEKVVEKDRQVIAGLRAEVKRLNRLLRAISLTENDRPSAPIPSAKEFRENSGVNRQ